MSVHSDISIKACITNFDLGKGTAVHRKEAVLLRRRRSYLETGASCTPDTVGSGADHAEARLAHLLAGSLAADGHIHLAGCAAVVKNTGCCSLLGEGPVDHRILHRMAADCGAEDLSPAGRTGLDGWSHVIHRRVAAVHKTAGDCQTAD